MSEKSWTKRGPEKSEVPDIYDIITIVYVSILRINHAQNIHYHKKLWGMLFMNLYLNQTSGILYT